MRYLVFVLFACCLFACNSEKSRDEQIKEILLANVSKGLSADAAQKVDSIVLVRVDSFTERSKVLMHIEEVQKSLEGGRKARNTIVEQMSKYGTREYWRSTHGYDADNMKKGIALDSVMLTTLQEKIAVDSVTLDSLLIKYENSPSDKFAGYYIIATVYFTFKHVSDTATLQHYLYKNDNLNNTRNLLLRELDWRVINGN